MKYLIVGDLHGRKPRILVDDFDAIIAPGDVAGDAHFRGATTKWIKSGMRVGWNEFMHRQFGADGIERIEAQNLSRGRKVLEYLDSLGKPVYFVPGNWDQSYKKTRIRAKSAYWSWRAMLERYSSKRSNPALTRGLANIIDCQLGLRTDSAANIIGYGLSSGPEDPDRYNGRVSRAELRDMKKRYKEFCMKLGQLRQQRKRKLPLVLLSHNVPHNTPIDKIIKPGTAIHGKHYGSTIARWFIDRYQPLICVGGHMHEYHNSCKIGKTKVINAGFGAKVNTLLEITNGKVRRLKFIKA